MPTPQSLFQTGILAPVPRQAAYVFLSREAGVARAGAAKALQNIVAARLPDDVIGLSAVFVASQGGKVPGLRPFVSMPKALVDLPATQSDVMVWMRRNDQGELFHAVRALSQQLAGVFRVDLYLPAFRHRTGHDLSGFEDGTENPKGARAMRAAFADDGASFLAVQQWEHHFARLDALSAKARNQAVGRDQSSNEELDDAPVTAHVKRTAQESFAPEAFVLRRSMPWVEGRRGGLMFAAFGRSFDAFEAQLARMAGAEDGKVDALFGFSRPLGGGYYWCPPVKPDGTLNLDRLAG